MKPRRLTLKKERLRQLTDAALAQVQGGVGNPDKPHAHGKPAATRYCL